MTTTAENLRTHQNWARVWRGNPKSKKTAKHDTLRRKPKKSLCDDGFGVKRISQTDIQFRYADV